jgi:hypothetical protein
MSVMHFIRIGAMISAAIFSIAPHFAARAQAGEWEWYRSERFGYSLLFPADLLSPREESQNGQGLEFSSGDGSTKLKILVVYNEDRVTPEQYRATLIKEFPEYGAIQYGPRGQSWFVLSGVRGSNIYYQKIMFACGGRVINAFALTYPEERKREYSAMVTTIEKNFHSASGAACSAASPQ